jgi:tRNA (guanine37-N1)-methyltransferase
MTLNFNLLTLFPDMFPSMLGQSLAGKALERGDWSFNTINIRDFATDTHKTVDDTPYGGGAGMVMRADVIEAALLSINHMSSFGLTEGSKENQKDPAIKSQDDVIGRKIYLSPRGKVFNQSLAKELSKEENITLLCGRYEGVDQRVLDAHEFEEISIGDYVLSGGEPAAMILMDACIRLLPGVMGNQDTADNESFGINTGGLLEYPHYTRPAEWTDANGVIHHVPEVLKNGNHAEIDNWREEESLNITRKIRPDLLK